MALLGISEAARLLDRLMDLPSMTRPKSHEVRSYLYLLILVIPPDLFVNVLTDELLPRVGCSLFVIVRRLSKTITARLKSCSLRMKTAVRSGSYTRALVAFRESDEQAATLVKNAWAANQHVPAILAGAKPAVGSDDGYITMGGPDEASYYLIECGAAWHRTPGAVAWLTELATTLPPKRRARARMH